MLTQRGVVHAMGGFKSRIGTYDDDINYEAATIPDMGGNRDGVTHGGVRTSRLYGIWRH